MISVTASENEEMNEPCAEKIYVAVGRDLFESVYALAWALLCMVGSKAASLVLLHVKVPLRYVPSPEGNIPVNRACTDVLDCHMMDEEEKWNDYIKIYLEICSRSNVRAETLVVENTKVSKGIVEMISELGITKLFMGTSFPGGAICKKMKMQGPGKADYVVRHAIESCQVSVVCKRKCVLVREAYHAQKRTGWGSSFHLPWIKPWGTSVAKTSPADDENHSILPQKKQIHGYQGIRTLLGFSQYSFADIKASTSNFSDNSKLGEGGYGTVYKGQVKETTIASKILRENSLQGRREFQHEIDLLRSIKHPHLVRVVGACFEQGCILYEYMSNGSLADRLSCKNSSVPVPWHVRIRIAAEVCSALHYLHTLKPDPVVHRDLKPENILLDKKFTSKISDFGLARILPQNRNFQLETEMKGTFPYIDPEYVRSGEFSTKSDVYSLGMVILQLLTGKPALGLVSEVTSALDSGKLNEVLDSCAGEWPSVQATKLACFALRCTETERRKRPDLQPSMMKKIDKLRDFAIAASNPGMRRKQPVQSGEVTHDPNVFLRPNFNEILNLNIL